MDISLPTRNQPLKFQMNEGNMVKLFSGIMPLRASILIYMTAALSGCAANSSYYDSFDSYSQRRLTISEAAGDAIQTNAIVQKIDPWPQYVYNTNIPGDGRRMSDAQERYSDVSKLKTSPKPLKPLYDDASRLSSKADDPNN
jgi:hypothetical protein